MNQQPETVGDPFFWILKRIFIAVIVLLLLVLCYCGAYLILFVWDTNIEASSIEAAIKRDCHITEHVIYVPDISWYEAQHGNLTITCESYDGPCHCTENPTQSPPLVPVTLHP